MKLFGWSFSVSTLAMAASLAGAAHAQEAPAPVAMDAQVDSAAAASAGDIVVTAQRRSENISSVPLSIQAFSGDKLAAAGVVDASGIAQVTSGLNFARSSANTPIYTLRGVGFNTPNLSSTSPVGVYVDEVAYPYPYMSNGPMFDMQRVEVLKGPQGTLYGRNTTGGLINFITNKPGDHLEGGIQLELGNYKTHNVEGFISTPLGDIGGLRVSGRYEGSDKGWQYSATRGDRLGEKDRLGLRAVLDLHPADNFNIELTGSYWRDKSDTIANQGVGFDPDAPAFVDPALPGYIKTDWKAGEADWDPASSGEPPLKTDSRFFGFASRMTWEVSPENSIVSLTAYNDIKRNDNNDVDGTPLNVFSYQSIGRIKSFSQELRFVHDGDRLKYTVGGYFSHDDIEDNQIGSFDISSILRQLRYVAGMIPDPRYTDEQKAVGFKNFRTTTDQSARSISGFANADYKLTDTLSASGGLRYSSDRLRYSACSRDYNGTTIPVWNTAVYYVAALSTGQAFAPGNVGENQCLTFNSDFTGVSPYKKPDLSEDNLSGRLALNWKPQRDLLVYGSLSRGFKTGAVPIIAGNVDTQFSPAKQERVTAYEIGGKFQLPDRLGRINLAGFLMDYKDKQLFGEVPDIVFTSLTRIVNVPKSQIYGFEVEAVLTPVRHLTLNGNLSYTHSEVKEYNGYDRLAQPTDFHGSTFPYTPKWQINGGVTYDAPVTDNWTALATVNASYQSSTSSSLRDEAGFEINSYTLVNGSIMFSQNPTGLRVGLWARNIFNKNYWTATDVLTDTIFRVPGMPRTYGLTIGYRF